MKLFALRHIETGRFMSFYADSNDGSDFCFSIQFSLEEAYSTDKIIWTTMDKGTAERAASSSTPWYNADATSPTNDFVGKLEVVESNMS